MVSKDRGVGWNGDGDGDVGKRRRLRLRTQIVSVRILFSAIAYKFTSIILEIHCSCSFLLNLRGLVEVSDPSRCSITVIKGIYRYICIP